MVEALQPVGADAEAGGLREKEQRGSGTSNRVRRRCPGANTRSGDIVSGALRFSPERMEASLDGEPVQLTRNEYRLLSVFLR
ncbi:MAG: hypothetical protein V8Q42_09735, partial [Anaerovoracaceae bacterium]